MKLKLYPARFFLLFAFTVSVTVCRAQKTEDVAFDAVAIRPAEATTVIEFAGTAGVVPAVWKPCEYLTSRVSCRLPLWALLREAFQVQEFELNAPEWTKSDMFDIQAVMPQQTSRDDARTMLRSALKDAFALEYHFDTRMTGVYALVLSQDASRLTVPDPEKPEVRTYFTPGGTVKTNQLASTGQFFSAGMSLDIFARNLQAIASLNRPVVNETGLTAKYVIDLKWKSSSFSEEVGQTVDPKILRAMEEQLGLKLVKKYESRTYLSIDRVSRKAKEL